MMEQHAMTPSESWAREYVRRGWTLVFMDPGSKGPNIPGWNGPAEVIDTQEKVTQKMARYAGQVFNLGLLHVGGTMAVDVDDLFLARSIFGEIGIDLDAVLAQGLRIVSPTENRAKVIFSAGGERSRKTVTWPARPGSGGRIPIIDMRGGGGAQDVLPPSSHPSGGFYAWAEGKGPGEEAKPPLIPDDLARFWTALDDPGFMHTLQGLCPWATLDDKPQQVVRRRVVSAERADTITKYNELTSIEEVLTRFGYKRRGRKWLSPYSSSGMPGVSVADGKAFVHHDSDPMNDGYGHDAFDFLVKYQHSDNFMAALEDAGNQVGFEPRNRRLDDDRPPVTAEMLAAIQQMARQAPGRRVSPAEAVAPPPAVAAPEGPLAASPEAPELPTILTDAQMQESGFIGRMTEWILSCAPRPNPVLAHVAALSVAGLVLGRKVATRSGIRTNQLLISVAGTGEGKDHPRKAIASLLRACGDPTVGGLGAKLIGPGDFASGAGLLSMIHEQPLVLCQVDEFGRKMAKWTNPKAAGHEADIATQLMESFSSAGGALTGVARADTKLHKAKVTMYPCLSVHGSTTPETLYMAIGSRHVEDGLLNRLMIFFAPPMPIELPQWNGMSEPPRDLVEWCEAAQGLGSGGGNLAAFDPSRPVVMGLDAEAQRLMDEFTLRAMRNSRSTSVLWQRAAEHAAKLAMIYACSQYSGPELLSRGTNHTLYIDGVAMRRACLEVDVVIRGTIQAVKEHVADNDFERTMNDVKRLIIKAGSRGMTIRDLTKASRAFNGIDDGQRSKTLSSLKSAGECDLVVLPGENSTGRPRKAWVSRQHINFQLDE